MIKATITIDGRSIPLKDVTPGETGSITDYSDNTLLIFKCNDLDDGGMISRSMYGFHVEEGDQRAITSGKLKELASIPANGGYSLAIGTKHGRALISFVHESENGGTERKNGSPQEKNGLPDRKKSLAPSGKIPDDGTTPSGKNPGVSGKIRGVSPTMVLIDELHVPPAEKF